MTACEMDEVISVLVWSPQSVNNNRNVYFFPSIVSISTDSVFCCCSSFGNNSEPGSCWICKRKACTVSNQYSNFTILWNQALVWIHSVLNHWGKCSCCVFSSFYAIDRLKS
ncbi:hypothetical protein BDA99DRAFT_537844 [Phascolomyces articulosus]|uniref:Uncharacterized protein n=1 Tax=Phascolomyces articulosus TaxID=60185 RepID=A0AAD5K8Z0_9FUNG|nr:hypothetical protein BDA99DRAFT_537844 [Phascolomyces articulosus]